MQKVYYYLFVEIGRMAQTIFCLDSLQGNTIVEFSPCSQVCLHISNEKKQTGNRGYSKWTFWLILKSSFESNRPAKCELTGDLLKVPDFEQTCSMSFGTRAIIEKHT